MALDRNTFRLKTEKDLEDLLWELQRDFSNQYALFYAITSLIKIAKIDETLQAIAAVSFQRHDVINKDFDTKNLRKPIPCLALMVNPSLKPDYKYNDWRFTVAHECLHIMMNHFTRYSLCKLIHGESPDFDRNFNISGDISINHLLLDIFDIQRESLSEPDYYCFVDTVFNEKNGFSKELIETISPDNSLEYFLELLLKQERQEQSESSSNNLAKKGDSLGEQHAGWQSSDGKENNGGDDNTFTDDDGNVHKDTKLTNPDEIKDALARLEEDIIEKIANKYGKSKDDIRKIMNGNGGGGIFGSHFSDAKSMFDRLSSVIQLNNQPKNQAAWNKFFAHTRKTLLGNEDDR